MGTPNGHTKQTQVRRIRHGFGLALAIAAAVWVPSIIWVWEADHLGERAGIAVGLTIELALLSSPVYGTVRLLGWMIRWPAERRLDIRRGRLKAGRCPDCDYDLRASPGRCPECGGVPTL